MLSHLNEDCFKDDSEPMPNFSLEGKILEPSDDLSCEGLHNSELPQGMKYGDLLRAETYDRYFNLALQAHCSTQTVFSHNICDALEHWDHSETHCERPNRNPVNRFKKVCTNVRRSPQSTQNRIRS